MRIGAVALALPMACILSACGAKLATNPPSSALYEGKNPVAPHPAILGSAQITVYGRGRTPRVVLSLPSAFKRGSTDASRVLDQFRSLVIGALDRYRSNVGKPFVAYAGTYPVSVPNGRAVPSGFELARVQLVGYGHDQSIVGWCCLHPIGSAKAVTTSQFEHYRADIIAAFDTTLKKLGWRGN